MERDAVIAHGMSLFLKEKLMDTSDAYSTFVCDKCGLFAQRLFRKGNQSHATSKDVYFCPSCKNYTEISKVMIPYAFKSLIQEMMAMDIAALLLGCNNIIILVLNLESNIIKLRELLLMILLQIEFMNFRVKNKIRDNLQVKYFNDYKFVGSYLELKI